MDSEALLRRVWPTGLVLPTWATVTRTLGFAGSASVEPAPRSAAQLRASEAGDAAPGPLLHEVVHCSVPARSADGGRPRNRAPAALQAPEMPMAVGLQAPPTRTGSLGGTRTQHLSGVFAPRMALLRLQRLGSLCPPASSSRPRRWTGDSAGGLTVTPSSASPTSSSTARAQPRLPALPLSRKLSISMCLPTDTCQSLGWTRMMSSARATSLCASVSLERQSSFRWPTSCSCAATYLRLSDSGQSAGRRGAGGQGACLSTSGVGDPCARSTSRAYPDSVHT